MENSDEVSGEEAALPDTIPVTMPELPIQLLVNTAAQFKAIGDPLRWRILNMLRYQPATAKQIAAHLSVAPGTTGHHLQVLEAAGLVQVVARRVTHGIIAKYYTRTARIFLFDFPPDITNGNSICLNLMTSARDELSETLIEDLEETAYRVSVPHARLSAERIQYYSQRIQELVDEFIQEPTDVNGEIYTLCMAFFRAPHYQQQITTTNLSASSDEIE